MKKPAARKYSETDAKAHFGQALNDALSAPCKPLTITAPAEAAGAQEKTWTT
jgi:hypothetical protein